MRTRSVSAVCWVESGFDLLAVGGLLHVLSRAGSRWNWRPFRVQLCSANGGLVASSAQAELQTVAATCITGDPELVVLATAPAANTAEATELATLVGRLKSEASPALLWVGLGRAVTTLVREGVARGLYLSAPRSEHSILAQLDPGLNLVSGSWHHDGCVVSCAVSDTTAAALHVIEHFFGASTARTVTNELGWPSAKIDVDWPADIPSPKA